MTKNIQVPDDFLQNLEEATAILGAAVMQMHKHAADGHGAGYAATQSEIDAATEVWNKLDEFLKSALDTHSNISDWSVIVERAFRDSTTPPEKF